MMWLKRLLRPLIPDRLMARYRLHQHSRQVRVNVDVIVAGRRARRRWLATTPDTYRVGGPDPSTEAPVFDRAEADTGRLPVVVAGATGPMAAQAAGVLAATGADAAVIGATARPAFVGRRRSEPPVDPVAIAVRRSAWEEVVGAPEGPDLVGLHRRLREAGRRVALVPGVAPEVAPRRRDRIERPVAVVLAAVPIHDVGGGSRGAQIALELVSRGFHVIYVALFGSHETTDLGLRFVSPALEQWRFDEIDGADIAGRASRPGMVLAEVPAPRYLEVVDALRTGGWRIVYDVVDRWSDPALGGDWYRPEAEARLVASAHAVIASALDLVPTDALRAALVPNAVNADVFGREPGPVPEDLPAGDGPLIGYHGSLYGDWIDWPAISRVAEADAAARVVLIGEGRNAPPLPANVHLLGLKAQGDLPDYVARFDVGLVPFVVSATTHAVSPLKVFEYLACGVPVAAPPLRSLEGLDGVTTHPSLEEAVVGALAGGRPDRAAALATHSWERRIADLLRVAEVDPPLASGEPVLVVRRPVVRYRRGERAL